jgi:hypothetical protein
VLFLVPLLTGGCTVVRKGRYPDRAKGTGPCLGLLVVGVSTVASVGGSVWLTIRVHRSGVWKSFGT